MSPGAEPLVPLKSASVVKVCADAVNSVRAYRRQMVKDSRNGLSFFIKPSRGYSRGSEVLGGRRSSVGAKRAARQSAIILRLGKSVKIIRRPITAALRSTPSCVSAADRSEAHK